MAKMLPERPLPTTASNAERKVFYALKDLLPAEYTVLHSVPIYRRYEHGGRVVDGEVDFIVLHPEKGYLVIEVKGGGIERDPTSGCWSSTGFDGEKHSIKDPYDQGRVYSYEISRELRNDRSTRKFNFPFFHCVWFPDVITLGDGLTIPQIQKAITLGKQDLETAAGAISRLFRTLAGETTVLGPGAGGVHAFELLFAPAIKLSLNLSSAIEEEGQRILEVTKSQYRILSLLQRHKRALICGPAGSGKTLLAVEKARRIVDSCTQARVLVTCFNVKLVDRIRELVGGMAGIDVYHYHGLCYKFCKESGINLSIPLAPTDADAFFKHEMTQYLFEALCSCQTRYDAIIVDEGQDFYFAWWDTLLEMLREPTDGIFYIFYDDNQAIYGREHTFPIESPPFQLEENCRNTKAIFKTAMKYYQGHVEPIPIGPDGRMTEIIKVPEGETEREAVERVLCRLLKDENLKPENIVILTPFSQKNSIWEEGALIAGSRLSWRTGSKNMLQCSTIHSFKGLESPVVIVTELDNVHQQSSLWNMMYVACSRPSSHLVVVGNSVFPN